MDIKICGVHQEKVKTPIVKRSHASQPSGFFTGTGECKKQGNLVAITLLDSPKLIDKVPYQGLFK